MHWVQHWLGLDDGSGTPYLFWSGIGSDIGELGIIGALAAHLRALNCEVHGCWRIGRHTTAAAHRVCRRHHPADSLTHADVVEAHAAALAQTEGSAAP